MKFSLALIFACGSQLASAVPTASTDVRVRLKHEQHSIEVSGQSLTITPPSAFLQVGFSPGLQRARITNDGHGTWTVRWQESGKQEKLTAERLWVRGEKLRLGARRVPGDLEIYRNAKVGIDVLARLELEDYLEGVLPSEMPLSWPSEALKAQVIAARSYVLRQAFEHRDKEFDVEDGIEDQVYRFKPGGDLREKLQRILRQTRGEILITPRNGILKAFYSADCGCRSEDPKYVWGGSEHGLESFQSVEDPTCHERQITKWNLVLDSHEARDRLISDLQLPGDASLKTLLLGGRTPSGRVSEVVATMSVGGKDLNFVMSTQEFRRLIGYSRIRSADFKLRWSGREILISGTGVGHGVGLCQRGARALAEQGLKHGDILKTFYPRARVQSWGDRVL